MPEKCLHAVPIQASSRLKKQGLAGGGQPCGLSQEGCRAEIGPLAWKELPCSSNRLCCLFAGISHILFTQGMWALLEVLFIDPESWESRQLLAEPHSVSRACCPGSCLLSHLASPQLGLKCQLMGPSAVGGAWGVSPGGPTTTRSNTTTTTTPNHHRRAPRLQPDGQLWELAGRWVLWGGGDGDHDKPEFQWHMQGRVGGLVQGHTAGVGRGWDSDPALSACRAPLYQHPEFGLIHGTLQGISPTGVTWTQVT